MIVPNIMVLQVPKDGSLCIGVPGNQLRGKDASAGLIPRQVNIEVQLMIKLLIDGRKCMALIDSGCLKTLMCKLVCRMWRPREVKVVTADGKTLT